MTGHASTSRVEFHRYDATVASVTHREMPKDKRQDTDTVVAYLDYADGAVWWVADEGTVKVGDRYWVAVVGPRDA